MLIAIQEDLKIIFYGRIFREHNLFLAKDFKPRIFSPFVSRQKEKSLSLQYKTQTTRM